MARRRRPAKKFNREAELLFGFTPDWVKPPKTRTPSAAEQAEHQGRTPQPGIPPGPRNTQQPSASGYEYSPAQYEAAGLTPPPSPVVREAARTATRSAVSTVPSVLVSKLADLLTPGPSRDIEEAAARLGVGGTLADGDNWAFSKEQLHPNEAEVGEKQYTPTPLKDPRAVLAKIPKGEREQGRQLLREVNDAIRSDNARKGKKAQARGGVRAAPADPRDPLGRKTLGDATVEQLAQAQRSGQLKVSKRGVLSTPGPRRALARLKAAEQRAAQATGITTGLGPNADAFADALAAYGDYDPQAIGAWVKSEGGAYENGGEAGPQNWLGIGYPGHQTPFAASPYFSGSPSRAGRAAGEWIEGKIGDDYNYGAAPSLQAAIQGAKGGSAQDLISALAASGWGTNVAHVQQNLSGVQVQHDPRAIAALQVAKRQARQQGINPTRFNGDVAGGGPDFTFVRADAKGMVDWAESALGTVAGSPRAERWGARFALNTVSQPWCASFVSNGLLRRGITNLPSNPNYVPTYESEWAQYNIGTELTKAKPGDLLTFSGQHIGIYVGNGEMISGNSSDAVSRTPAQHSAPLSAILRPPYKGGKVKVADVQVAGSSMESALGSVGGASVGTGGEAVAPAGTTAAAAQRQQRPPAVSSVPMQLSDLLSTQSLAPRVGQEEGGEEGILEQLLRTRSL